MLESMIKKKLFTSLENIQRGQLFLTTPEGEKLHFQGAQAGETANIAIEDWRTVMNLKLKGDIGFAEDYRDGYWHTDNLSSLFQFGMQNENIFGDYTKGNTLFRQLTKGLYRRRKNSLQGSKRNIHEHYDIGNAFYQLWLDKSMTYSAAIFSSDNMPLEIAQERKYDRILNKLEDKSTILEVGCGWGGLAERALERDDFYIKGITLSEEQQLYAKKRLGNSVNIAVEDYRHQKGKYDYIVSIEMLEAVGKAYWPIYFKKLKGLLKKHGKIVLQSITIADDRFDAYRKGTDFIRRHIFPGGFLPCMKALHKEVAKAELKITDEYHFGMDYARTLEVWLENFNKNETALLSLGYDKRFQRIWRFYLASCIATFCKGNTDVVQLELCHA